MTTPRWWNVNEDGEAYDSHPTQAQALLVQAEFPNDRVVQASSAAEAEAVAFPTPEPYTYRLHYWSQDVHPDVDDVETWSVYVEHYESPSHPEPIDGSQEFVSTHGSREEAEAEGRRLQEALGAQEPTEAQRVAMHDQALAMLTEARALQAQGQALLTQAVQASERVLRSNPGS